MAKSRRKKLIIILLSVVIVLALLVVGDRIAASFAEGKISEAVEEQANDKGIEAKRPPDVSITGFPFLTQVLGGEYSQIDIEMVGVGNDEVALSKVDITAKEVQASMSDLTSGEGEIVAKTLDAKGAMDLDVLTESMEDASEAKVTPGEDNTLNVEATTEVAGQAISVTGTALVTASENAIRVEAQDFQANEQLPPGGDEIVSAMAASFNRDIAIPELPYGLTLGDLEFSDDQMELSASAKDVPLN